jgi:hypothetical protein
METFFRYCVMGRFWRAYFTGLFHAIRLSSKMVKKRIEIQRTKSMSNFELELLFIASERERKGGVHQG